MFSITTKFHKILLSGFRGVALTNCFSSIFHFGQISKFKKINFSQKKIESKFPVDMHIYALSKSYITTKFHEILLSGFRGVALTNCLSCIVHFGQISKLKKGVIPRKKLN